MQNLHLILFCVGSFPFSKSLQFQVNKISLASKRSLTEPNFENNQQIWENSFEQVLSLKLLIP